MCCSQQLVWKAAACFVPEVLLSHLLQVPDPPPGLQLAVLLRLVVPGLFVLPVVVLAVVLQLLVLGVLLLAASVLVLLPVHEQHSFQRSALAPEHLLLLALQHVL
jgi:hypothetical protein